MGINLTEANYYNKKYILKELLNMTIEVTDNPEIISIINYLHFQLTDSKLNLVPENLESAQSNTDFCYQDSTADFMIFCKSAGVECQKIVESEKVNRHQNIDLWLPTALVTVDTIIHDSSFVSVCCGVLANYVTEFVKRFRSNPMNKNKDINIHSNVIVQKRNGEVKKASYNGPSDSFHHFTDMVTKL